MEKKLVEDANLEVKYVEISTGKLRRYFSFENFKDFFKVSLGIFESYRALKRFNPDVVFSKGGFVSLPVSIACFFARKKLVLHESDLNPGLANKISMRFADRILLSFEKSKVLINQKYLDKCEVIGGFVREEILEGDSEKARKSLKFDKYRPVVLVMGGSQGSAQINKLVDSNFKELMKRFQVVHIRGKGNLKIELKHQGYRQFEFLKDELFDIYQLADLVVSRGGANSLAEIAALGKKAIIIPLGLEASRGDQIENAKIYSQQYGWSILEGDIADQDFMKAIDLAANSKINENKFSNGLNQALLVLEKYLASNL